MDIFIKYSFSCHQTFRNTRHELKNVLKRIARACDVYCMYVISLFFFLHSNTVHKSNDDDDLRVTTPQSVFLFVHANARELAPDTSYYCTCEKKID